MEQGDPTPAGHQQVGPAVAVVVGHSRGVGIKPGRTSSQGCQACAGRDILKLATSQVAIQFASAAQNRVIVRAGKITAPGKIEIQQAVLVEINLGQAAAERFKDGEVGRSYGFAVVIGTLHATSRTQILEKDLAR